MKCSSHFDYTIMKISIDFKKYIIVFFSCFHCLLAIYEECFITVRNYRFETYSLKIFPFLAPYGLLSTQIFKGHNPITLPKSERRLLLTLKTIQFGNPCHLLLLLGPPEIISLHGTHNYIWM